MIALVNGSASRWVFLLTLWLCTPGCSSPRSLEAIQRRPDDPLLPAQITAKVLIFVNNDCPIANGYAPVIRRLHEQYAPRGIAFWLVHSDPEETLASIRQHDSEYGLNLPVLLDPHQTLVQAAQAEVVPSAAVFSQKGQLVYHGRIDDRFAEIGRERPEATRRDLEQALEAVLAHRPVEVPATKAIGCYIPGTK